MTPYDKNNLQILDPPIMPGVKAYSEDFEAKLMYLDLSMATVSEEGLAEIFSKCFRLKKLSLEACAVNAVVCKHLANNIHLEVLNLSNTRGLTEEGIQYILNSCTQ